MSLRHVYRVVWRRARFNVAVLVTIVAVAYVAVPHVTRLAESVGGYNPAQYEPRDLERGAWVQRGEHRTLLSRVSWDVLINVALFVLVAVVWLTLVPTRRGRRTPYH